MQEIDYKPDARLCNRLIACSRLFAALGALIGLLVFVGWIIGSDVLKAPLPGSGYMKANTALGLALLGTAMLVPRSRVSQILAGMALLTAGLTLVEYGFGIDARIDQLLFIDAAAKGLSGSPGRMAPSAAMNFTALGIALFLLRGRRYAGLAQFIAFASSGLSLLNIFNFVYRAGGAGAVPAFVPAALPTSVAFLFLSTALILGSPAGGMMSTITSPGPGGLLARRFLPLAVLGPGFLGWLDWQAQQRGVYSTGFGHATFSMMRILVLIMLIWVTARMLNRIELSSEVLRRRRTVLEDLVAARTAELTTLNRELQEELNARRVAQEALRKSEERYMLALVGANDGLWDWDLSTNQIYFSSRWKSMLGCGENEIGADPEHWLSRIHPLDSERVRRELAAHCGGHTGEFESEYRILHKDGAYRWVLCRGLAVRGAEGQAIRFAGSQTDITQNKISDPLTGLPNRILFTDRLTFAIESWRENRARLYSVLFLDLDRFKDVNDSMGHLAGDQLLIGIGERLRACFAGRSGNGEPTLARLGGDEFVVLLENLTDPDQALIVADAIFDFLREPFLIEGRQIFCSASIGVAPASPAYRSSDEVLRDADTAMYVAKMKGKAQTAVFDASMGERAKVRLNLGRDLHHALERGEFFLEYQPIVMLRTGRVTGFEALLRWRHPDRGHVPPQDFISVAEETGLIVPIGEWVLEEACRQTSVWNAEFGEAWTIDVNLSGKQLLQPSLSARVAAILRDSKLDPFSLNLEVTESVLMSDTETVVVILDELKAMGVGLTIDDFGTGYSSLSYLHRLPFDTLKIDRSFVDGIDGSKGGGQAIVKTIMNLSENLQMSVIAEGIENAQQWAQLRSLACTHGQGFYIAPPLSVSEATEFLTKATRELPVVPPEAADFFSASVA
jgi:diguanylate cyclase (GGDEF)-like protein/PAS domain S-box-containing protein